jgi:hypothetical protein
MSWEDILKVSWAKGELRQDIDEEKKDILRMRNGKRIPKTAYDASVADETFAYWTKDANTREELLKIMSLEEYASYVEQLAFEEAYREQPPFKRKKKEKIVEDKPKKDYPPLW